MFNTCFHIYIHSIIHDGYLGTKSLLQKLRIKCGITLSKISSRKIHIKNSIINFKKHLRRGQKKLQICNKFYNV